MRGLRQSSRPFGMLNLSPDTRVGNDGCDLCLSGRLASLGGLRDEFGLNPGTPVG